MCVFAIRARISCSIVVKLAVIAGGIGCQVIAGLTSPVLPFAESCPSISAYSFADDGHFLIIVPIGFRFLLDLIRCPPTFEFKPIIIILNRSHNVVAVGIGGQASGAVARRRRATLLVCYNYSTLSRPICFLFHEARGCEAPEGE